MAEKNRDTAHQTWGVGVFSDALGGAKMILSPSVLQQPHLLLSHLELKIKLWEFMCSQSLPSVSGGQSLTWRTAVDQRDGIRVAAAVW